MTQKTKIATWLTIVIISGHVCFFAFSWLYQWIINIINQILTNQ